LLSRLKQVCQAVLLPPELPELVVTERLLWSSTTYIDAVAKFDLANEVLSTADLVDAAIRALAAAKEVPLSVAASTPAIQPSSVRLSRRERQVLGLLANGLTTREIAGVLIVSPRTARYHVGSILGKLGATNRAQAVALGLQNRLIDASVPTSN